HNVCARTSCCPAFALESIHRGTCDAQKCRDFVRPELCWTVLWLVFAGNLGYPRGGNNHQQNMGHRKLNTDDASIIWTYGEGADEGFLDPE
ncbi:unnamed protein product, partial [Sphacelaria rigidula]